MISTENMIEREIGMMMVIENAIVRKTEMIENAKVIDIGTATVIVETVIVGVEREIVVAVIGIAIMTVIEKEIGRETILDGLVHEKEREKGE